MKKVTLIILLFTLFIPVNLSVASASDSDRQIITQIYCNVMGDEEEEIIVLSGNKKGDGSFFENLKINVFEDKSGKLLHSIIPTVNYGFNPTVSAINFSLSGHYQIFYKSDSDNLIKNVYVYTFKEQEPKILYDFDLEISTLSARYDDYYKVLVSSLDNNYKVDISYKGKEYLSKIYTNNGKLLKQIPARVSKAVNAFPYLDGNTYYLAVTREISGETESDILCTFVTLLELKENSFTLFKQFITI